MKSETLGIGLVILLIVASLFAANKSFSADTTVPVAYSTACSRFVSGNYVAVTDDSTRSLNALGQMDTFYSQSNSMANFKGYWYAMNWGMLEKSPGVYDFSRLDAAVAKAKSQNKKLWLVFNNRTFHVGCNSTPSFLPSYVSKEAGRPDRQPNFCIAKIWERPTMDHMIRVLKAIALRYKDNTSFAGIELQETSFPVASVMGHPDVTLQIYENLRRAHAAIRSVTPNIMIKQMVNWPMNGDINYFKNYFANPLVALGGGAIGWPDSIPSNWGDPRWPWYPMGRDYNKKLAIIPAAQTAFIEGTPAATEEVYRFLRDIIGAHMIIWSTYHSSVGSYFPNSVVPTVNKFGGKLANTACPW
jgi:hypothetical protein